MGIHQLLSYNQQTYWYIPLSCQYLQMPVTFAGLEPTTSLSTKKEKMIKTIYEAATKTVPIQIYVEEEYLLGSWGAEYHPAVGKMKLFCKTSEFSF